METSYEPFSLQPEYIECNRRFIESLPFEKAEIVLDLACGTGTLSELVIAIRPGVSIIGLDLSRESLLIGQRHFKEQGLRESPLDQGEKAVSPFLIEGTADCLPLKEATVDIVIMGNSIHILPDKDTLLGEVRRVLKPGGIFAFNSAFYAGTYPPGTEKVYHEWLKQAIVYISKKDKELKRKGMPGIQRKRGTVRPAFSEKWPTPQEFSKKIEENGFIIISTYERLMMMNRKSFETVGAYAGLATVLLSGFSAKVACEALEASAGPAFDAFNLFEIPRLWLEVISKRL